MLFRSFLIYFNIKNANTTKKTTREKNSFNKNDEKKNFQIERNDMIEKTSIQNKITNECNRTRIRFEKIEQDLKKKSTPGQNSILSVSEGSKGSWSGDDKGSKDVYARSVVGDIRGSSVHSIDDDDDDDNNRSDSWRSSEGSRSYRSHRADEDASEVMSHESSRRDSASWRSAEDAQERSSFVDGGGDGSALSWRSERDKESLVSTGTPKSYGVGDDVRSRSVSAVSGNGGDRSSVVMSIPELQHSSVQGSQQSSWRGEDEQESISVDAAGVAGSRGKDAALEDESVGHGSVQSASDAASQVSHGTQSFVSKGSKGSWSGDDKGSKDVYARSVVGDIRGSSVHSIDDDDDDNNRSDSWRSSEGSRSYRSHRADEDASEEIGRASCRERVLMPV